MPRSRSANISGNIISQLLNVATLNVSSAFSSVSSINTATANITTIVTGNTLTLSTATGSNANIVFSANGTEYLRISNTGSVGIGTTASIANGTLSLRSVTNKIVLSGSSYATNQFLTSLGTKSGAEAFLIFGNNGQNEIRAGHSARGGYLDFYANNTLGQESASDGSFVARMHANGSVSIGTSTMLGTASHSLSVYSESGIGLVSKANTSDYTFFSLSPQNKAYGFFHSTGNTFILREVGVTDVMQINPSGRVNFPSQPAFSTLGTTYTQSGSIGVASIIIPTSMLFNVGSHYNLSTGVFTAPVAGKYYFAFWGLAYPLPEGDRVSIRYRKNGVAIHTVEHNGNTGSHAETSGCMFIELAANDTVDLTFTRDVGTTAYAYTTQWTMIGYLVC